MVNVPSAAAYGFRLELDVDVMHEVLNSSELKAVLSGTADTVRTAVVSHVEATASEENAANYAAALFEEEGFSDEYGFDFHNPYSLGDRPIVVIGVPAGRGPNPSAKPPMLTESEHHSLTSVPGFVVGGRNEDVR